MWALLLRAQSEVSVDLVSALAALAVVEAKMVKDSSATELPLRALKKKNKKIKK